MESRKRKLNIEGGKLMLKSKSKLAVWLTTVAIMASLFSPALVNDAHAGIANGSKFLGNIIANSVPSNFATYWDQVTPENSTKWGAVEATRNSMNWSAAD